MNGLDQALSTLGAEIGMPGLTLGAAGNVALELESGRRVVIEPAGDEVLIYVSDPAPYDAADRLLRAWRRAHYSRLEGLAVQAALRDQDGVPRLLALTRLAAAGADARALEHTIDTLSRWLDATRED